jgi:fructose-1,6-bisphosphatase
LLAGASSHIVTFNKPPRKTVDESLALSLSKSNRSGNVRENQLGYATETLQTHLAVWRKSGGRADVAETVLALAAGACELSAKIAVGPLLSDMGALTGNGATEKAGGDQQKRLDLEAHTLFNTNLANAPVAIVGSEEHETAEVLDVSKPLAVAIDPLDGSSNIDTNLSIGTIFAIFPVPVSGTGSDDTALLQPDATNSRRDFSFTDRRPHWF